jgi:hypothetical protein
MTHPRKLIRNAMVARLTDATVAGPRVYAGRPAPLEEQDLPAIVVHTREPEDVETYPASGWNGFTRRKCIALVECYLQSFDDVDDDLDDFADQVEAMFESWEMPGFESGEIRLATTNSEVEWDGSLSTGCIKLRYEVIYRRPYRECSNPYVQAEPDSIYRSGAYPGGQVVAGCPADNTGEACPVGTAELFSQEEPIH